jgi:hypothetical protein
MTMRRAPAVGALRAIRVGADELYVRVFWLHEQAMFDSALLEGFFNYANVQYPSTSMKQSATQRVGETDRIFHG